MKHPYVPLVVFATGVFSSPPENAGGKDHQRYI